MSATIEGAAQFRPLSVRKIDGEWNLVDLGGLLGKPTLFGWVVTPFRRACCWSTAVAMADALAHRYRGQELPSWMHTPGAPPGCHCDQQEPTR